MKRMLLGALLFLLVCCGNKETSLPPDPQPDSSEGHNLDEPPLPMRGYLRINNLIKSRLLHQDAPFALDQYFRGDSDPEEKLAQLQGLSLLLGFRHGSGMEQSRRNVLPNTFSMLLWSITIKGLAKDIGQSCDVDRSDLSIALSDHFYDVVAKACSSDAPTDAILGPLWQVLMRLDGTAPEYRAWREYLREASTDMTGSEFVATALYTALLHPEFLVER